MQLLFGLSLALDSLHLSSPLACLVSLFLSSLPAPCLVVLMTVWVSSLLFPGTKAPTHQGLFLPCGALDLMLMMAKKSCELCWILNGAFILLTKEGTTLGLINEGKGAGFAVVFQIHVVENLGEKFSFQICPSRNFWWKFWFFSSIDKRDLYESSASGFDETRCIEANYLSSQCI